MAGHLADQRVERAAGRHHLARCELGTRDAELRPRQGTRLDDGGVQRLRFGVPVEPQVQLGADARGVEPIDRALLEARLAQLRGSAEVAALDGLEHVAQHALALARLADALAQARRGVRLDQVAVERRLGGLGDPRVRRLAGDHDEHGGEGQQLLAPELVQQVLARHVGAVEVVVAQHHVELPVLEDLSRVLHPARLHHRADAEVAKLRAQHAA